MPLNAVLKTAAPVVPPPVQLELVAFPDDSSVAFRIMAHVPDLPPFPILSLSQSGRFVGLPLSNAEAAALTARGFNLTRSTGHTSYLEFNR